MTNELLEWLRNNYGHLGEPIQAKAVQHRIQAHFQASLSLATVCKALRLGLGFSYRKIYPQEVRANY